MTTAAGSKLPPATSTATATATAAAPLRRKSNPGSPWTDQETSHLIDAYEERWYSLKRGQLKAQQWEEVAAQVSARCAFSFPSKNGTQCRHKIEKLRKRYRSDRLRSVRSTWPFFDRIDRMERGPVPIRAESDEEEYCGSNMRSIHGILRQDFTRNLGKRRKLRDVEDKEEEEDEEEEEEEKEVREMAVELRRFGENYVKMERRRMDVMREMEREWMEMEAKRMEMIMEAQRGFMESIARAFSNKGKNLVEM